jgi:hypothetical protein
MRRGAARGINNCPKNPVPDLCQAARARIFIRRGAAPGMNNYPENPVPDLCQAARARIFIGRGAAPGMSNCPENDHPCCGRSPRAVAGLRVLWPVSACCGRSPDRATTAPGRLIRPLVQVYKPLDVVQSPKSTSGPYKNLAKKANARATARRPARTARQPAAEGFQDPPPPQQQANGQQRLSCFYYHLLAYVSR